MAAEATAEREAEAASRGAGRTVLLLVPSIFGCVVLAAHFLRQFDFPMTGLCLLLPFLLLIPRAWVARLIQGAMLLAAVSWLGTLRVLVAERQAAGLPWLRLAVILGAVAAVTLVGGALFETRRLRRRYGLRTAHLFRAAPPRTGGR